VKFSESDGKQSPGALLDRADMNDLHTAVQEAVSFLRQRVDARPEAAIILGTGLGGVAERIDVSETVPYEEIPHFPRSTVEGHKGNLLFGTLGGRPVVAMQGRFHFYEGYSLQQATIGVRIMRRLGAELLFINSAAGGLNPLFRAGDVMIVTDHINLLGDNPLRGVVDQRMGDRFPEMSRPYDGDLLRLAGEVALEKRIVLRYGVYVAVSGPSLETPAETRMLRFLGADAVGMSTVPEVIVACQEGFRTMVLAPVTNVNLPDCMAPISLEQVVAKAAATEPVLSVIIEETLRRAL
jgi:purine-nucleoside phosphorylase